MRANKTSMKSFFLSFLGSLLFVISDSLLASEKFRMNGKVILHIGTLSTYFIGQYFIMIGAVKHNQFIVEYF